MFERIKAILIKEFRQILRDRRMKFVLFVMPVFQMTIFGFAVSTDVKKIETAVYDLDNTPQSRDIIREFSYSKYFVLTHFISTDSQQQQLIDKSAVNVVIRINRGFAQAIEGKKTAYLQIILDGTDSNVAGVILSYASQIIGKYAAKIEAPRIQPIIHQAGGLAGIDLENRTWFNENLESRNFYIPGIIALLLLILTILLTAMAIVKEKEAGTIEQLIVSPLKPIELIIGKLTPFAIIGFVDIFLIAACAALIFHIPIRGSLLLLTVASACYLLTTLGFGLFISAVSKTQQEAMMSTFFIVQPAVLLSGFVFPIANMPKLIQYITYFNPLRYFLVIIRGIFLKGSGIDILWPQMLALFIIGVSVITISSLRFHKNLG